MVKKLYASLILGLSIIFCMDSCVDSESLLDKEESNDIYEDMVFTDPYNAIWFLNNIYKSMNDGFNVFGSDDSGGFLGNAVDEGIWKANWDNAYKMSSGAWTTENVLINYDPWKKYYKAIVDNNPSQKVFWNGWMSRLERNRALI